MAERCDQAMAVERRAKLIEVMKTLRQLRQEVGEELGQVVGTNEDARVASLAMDEALLSAALAVLDRI